MSTTLDQLLGNYANGQIRGIGLGSPLSEAIEKEGDDFSERKKQVKYFKDVAPGEEVELVLFHDDDRRVSALTLYFNYFLAAHDDDQAPFEQLADEVHGAFTKLYGDPEGERRGSGAKETMIRTWRLPESSSKLVSMTYTVEDRHDYRYDRRVLQVEHRRDGA